MKALGKRLFGCQQDAQEAVNKLEKGLRYHRVQGITIKAEPYYTEPGRPSKSASPAGYHYRLELVDPNKKALVRDEAEISKHQRKAGRFILATSLLEEKALPAEEVLQSYLSQQVVERGFRFLKDPLFFASSVFLKSPKRIAALAMVMVMGLCLLVYSLGERELRRELAKREESIPDRLGRPAQRPTLRWVFQLFQAVHLVDVIDEAAKNNSTKVVYGLTEERKHILSFFSSECRRNHLLT